MAVAARLDNLASEVARTREAVEAHDRWHRDQMTAAAAAGRTRRIMITSVIVSAFAAASAVAGEITTIIIR